MLLDGAELPIAASRRRLTTIALLTVALFILANALLFFTNVYRRVVDPQASTGTFERAIAQIAGAPADARRDVLVLGDSRIYGGLDPRIASAAAGGRFRFANAGVPGSTPRTWFFFDRAIDPHANRYRAVVVPVDSYADDTSAIGSLDAEDHPSDLRAIVFRVTAADVPRVASSLGEPGLRRAAILDLGLRGPLLRDDIQDLIGNPAARAAARNATVANEFAPDAAHPFATTLDGMRVDFANGTIAYPAWVPPGERIEMEKQILPIPRTSLSYRRYRERWLGAIVARYRATGVPVIVVRLPARPVHRDEPTPPSGSLAAFAAAGAVQLVPQAPYVALERPAFFADHDHLDAAGSRRFSALLGRDVAHAIVTPGAFSTGPASPTTATAGDAPPAEHHGRIHGLLAALGIGVPIPIQTLDYVLFLGLVALAFYASPRRVKPAVLLAASYYFYARWNAWYVVLLAALTLSDFAVGIALDRPGGAARRLLLGLGIAANLAFLGTFKYLNFITSNVAAILGYHGDPWALDVLVPVGISFHTFQSISYLVDVSRGKTKAIRNLASYALYIAFFPQLLAGPIVRAGRFFGEFAHWHAPDIDEVERGVREIVLGLLKKLAIADRFAPVANDYFGNVAAHPGAPAAWSAAFAFAMQIYFDFSGYSDIAIGSARLLGFDFPDNFHRPYLATSIGDFWRRWHISLSTWLRDYLYIPLGGNRGGTLGTLRNLMLTMLLGGLWHGAGWTFVAWGGYHGALLCLERVARVARGDESRGVERALRVGATFALVSFGWILFRAQNFDDARRVIAALVVGGGGPSPLVAWTFAPLAVALAIGIAQERGARWTWRTIPVGVQAAAGTTALLALELLSWPGPASSFVYFRF